MIAPVLEELAQETPDAKIVKVNVDHSPDVVSENLAVGWAFLPVTRFSDRLLP
jgi:hypothetical protein